MEATKLSRTSVKVPQPGDLIDVAKSEWYAVKDGDRVQVVEPFWAPTRQEFTICPVTECRSFWGPSRGPATYTEQDRMSTSGGPFKTLNVEDLDLEYVGPVRHKFWCWKDIPRANGGEDYFREVSLWKLKQLRKRYE